MRKIKNIFGVALIIAISFICSPSKSTAESIGSTNQSNKATSGLETNDEKMLVCPKYNCDPKMLILGEPNIDPDFLFEHLP